MKNLYKKFAASLGIIAIFALPLTTQASFLGIATAGDISNIEAVIQKIQDQIDDLRTQLQSFDGGNLGSALPSSPALVDTYLASGIGTSDTSMVLAKGTTSDGVTLAGYMCFTLDVNTPQLEYVCGNASGTSVTSMIRGLGFWNPNTTSSALQFTHRRLASVQSTDYPTLQLITRQLTSQDGISSTNPLFYDHSVTCSSALQLCPKSYVDSVASSGAANASLGIKGLVAITTPNGAPTSTDGAGILYSLISKQYYASSTQGATTTVVMTNGSGTISTTFISPSSTYTVGGLVTPSLVSASTTLSNATGGLLAASSSGFVYSIQPSSSGNLLQSNGSAWNSVFISYPQNAQVTATSSPAINVTTTTITMTLPSASSTSYYSIGFFVTGQSNTTTTISIGGTQVLLCQDGGSSSADFVGNMFIHMLGATNAEVISTAASTLNTTNCSGAGKFTIDMSSAPVLTATTRQASGPINVTTTISYTYFK